MAKYELNATDLPSGTNVIPNSGSDQTAAIFDAIELAKFGGPAGNARSIYFPTGVYLISGNIFDANQNNSHITIRGDGPQSTVFKLIGDYGNLATDGVFKISSNAGKASWFTLKDLSLDGDGHVATWCHFKNASLIRLDRVRFHNTLGYGIYAIDWQDSCLHDVHFTIMGDGPNTKASMALFSGDVNDHQTSCNNLKFEACRWENHPYLAVNIGATSRLIFFLGCKWHGRIASPFTIQTQLKITNTYTVSVVGCRFTAAGPSHIDATDSFGLLVSASVFDNTQDSSTNRGIKLSGCHNCSIVGNNFAAGDTSGPNHVPYNYRGNISLSNCTNIKTEGNVAIPTAGAVNFDTSVNFNAVERGEITLDGSNPTSVTTGLTSITSATATIKKASTPGDDPVQVTVNYGGGVPAGQLDIYAWKTNGTDPTLIASTNNNTVISWTAVGASM